MADSQKVTAVEFPPTQAHLAVLFPHLIVKEPVKIGSHFYVLFLTTPELLAAKLRYEAPFEILSKAHKRVRRGRQPNIASSELVRAARSPR